MEAEKVLARRDTSESDLRASFRRALSFSIFFFFFFFFFGPISFSIPPPTFYRNHCPSAHPNSGLLFGVPLVGLETNQDNVSKVMKICIEEVEERGLDTKGIYSVNGQSCTYWEFIFSSTGRIFTQCTSTTGQLYSPPMTN
jgi:hypothetical protein